MQPFAASWVYQCVPRPRAQGVSCCSTSPVPRLVLPESTARPWWRYAHSSRTFTHASGWKEWKQVRIYVGWITQAATRRWAQTLRCCMLSSFPMNDKCRRHTCALSSTSRPSELDFVDSTFRHRSYVRACESADLSIRIEHWDVIQLRVTQHTTDLNR